jgi:hypothetical protein
MKTTTTFILAVFLFFYVLTPAQVNMTIIVQKPTPTTLSSWQTLPNVIQLVVTNTTLNPYSNCIFSFKVKDQNEKVLLKTKDWEWQNMPKFNIPSAPGTLIITAPELIGNDALWVDEQIKTTVTTTNSLPEGDYSLCINILDNFGNPILNGGEKCETISIVLAEPPYLTMPEDKQLLTNVYPQFFWTPAIVSPYYINVGYRLKIVKLFAGQNAANGINTNLAICDKVVHGTSYQYLPSDFNLNSYSDEWGYAWQIQVWNDATNQPIPGISNSGKSEVWTFLPQAADQSTLKLITPADNAEVSPVNGIYNFTWDASKQKKSISSFILKIVEVSQGQSPESAIKTNQPVFYRNDIPPSNFNFMIGESQNIFYDNLNYAWQVWTVSTAWGGIIDTSEVRGFHVKSSFVETLTAVTPLNNTVCASDTGTQSGFLFDWNRDNVKKSISEYKLTIAPVDSGQTPAQALKINTPVLEQTMVEAISQYRIYHDSGVLQNNKKYAWIVVATSKSYNNQVVAKTEPQLFSVTGAAELAENVTDFFIGKYKIKVTSVTNKNMHKFSGKGETRLWYRGPLISFNFHDLSIVQFDTLGAKYLKVKAGTIWESITIPDVPLTIGAGSNPALSAKIKLSVFRISPTYSTVMGVIKLITPFMKNENNVTSNLVIETSGDFMNIDPQSRIKIDTVYLRKNLPEYKLIQPLNYYLSLSSFSRFAINNNKLDLYLNGSITLPDKFKDRDGNKIEFIFNAAPGFRFDVDNSNHSCYYKLTTNNDLLCHVQKVNIDLFNGKVNVYQGELNFDSQKFGISPISLGTGDGLYFTLSGFCAYINRQNLTQKVTYRGYDFSINQIRLKINNDAFDGNNYLKGNVVVPFINQNASMSLNLGKSGALGGDINASFIQNWLSLQKANQGTVELKLKIVGMTYSSYNNSFYFNGYFKFTSQTVKGLSTDQMAVSAVRIDSLGKLSIFGADVSGWIPLPIAKVGNFNGFPITVSKFRIAQYQHAYNFSVGGYVVLADNLSNPGGSEFQAGIDMPQGISPGGMAPSDQEIQSEPTGVTFGNDQSDFKGQVKYFENDPVFGNGFMASMSVMLHNPGDFGASSKILIGKTNNGNGYSYWYLQAQATLPSPGISTGILDIAVRSFEGRIYSHMKHSGSGIMSDDYVPDPNHDFGIFGNIGIETSGNDGMTLWGNVALEVVIGPGFTSTLAGHVNMLSSGWGNEDGMVVGDAIITVSTSPKLFDANFSVNVNLKGAFCAQGSLKMHIDESTWYLRVGTKQAPVTANLLCSQSGYHGYFDIEQTYTAFGMGYSFDTGYQEWGEGIGCWGRAWGGIDADANISYSPLQFTGSASISGSAQVGVFVNLRVWKGKLALLSGSVTASLALAFPDPVCMAGKIHAEGCIDPCPVFSCDICFGATLKLRYKNGSFALKDNCD